MRYNWQQKDWTAFTYDLSGVEDDLLAFAEKTGKVSGIFAALPEQSQVEAMIEIMIAEAIKTSAIEGEFLSRRDVMSSIRNNMGLASAPEAVADKRAEGMASLMIEVRNSYADPFEPEVLFAWHRMVMEGNEHTLKGTWRSHEVPMQVVSGAMGREKIHFEAPPSSRVPTEMDQFFSWFNVTGPGGVQEIRKAPIRSAIAHLYFESVHPFEDGNGRIGRAISEKALAQGLGRPVILSLSRSIEREKRKYYDALERAQRSNEITPWINYFVPLVLQAQTEAEEMIEFSLKKVKYFDQFREKLSERQLKVIKRMLQKGAEGFEGGMNARKYMGITKVSKPTATRDLQELSEISALQVQGSGRSTHYLLPI